MVVILSQSHLSEYSGQGSLSCQYLRQLVDEKQEVHLPIQHQQGLHGLL